MAIIVQHKKTKKKLVLLGVGYGAYKSSRPGFFGGNLFPNEEEGSVKAVSVCDKEGNILWISSDMIKVIEVDGVKINELSILLVENKDEYNGKSKSVSICPGCNEEVSLYCKECPNCGLTLIDSDYERMVEMAKNKK